MANEKKYYVVWQGRVPGVYDTWQECKAQIDGFPAARYKGFPTKEQAQAAFGENPNRHWGTLAAGQASKSAGKPTGMKAALVGAPIRDAICVDAAWNTASGDMEYQGVYYKTGGLIFRKGPYPDGTNNIGEFLAIVHALGYCKNKQLLLPIYSDSRTAIAWVQRKKANTKLDPTPRNAELFDLIQRAEQWLKDNTLKNPILKWETTVWGENPADFGRK